MPESPRRLWLRRAHNRRGIRASNGQAAHRGLRAIPPSVLCASSVPFRSLYSVPLWNCVPLWNALSPWKLPGWLDL